MGDGDGGGRGNGGSGANSVGIELTGSDETVAPREAPSLPKQSEEDIELCYRAVDYMPRSPES